MCRYFVAGLTIFIVSVLSRDIPYYHGQHTNTSVCEGQLLTRACKNQCLDQELHALCTIPSVHICVCKYRQKMIGKVIDNNRIAVIIKLENWDPNDSVVDSEEDETSDEPASDAEPPLYRDNQNAPSEPPQSASTQQEYPQIDIPKEITLVEVYPGSEQKTGFTNLDEYDQKTPTVHPMLDYSSNYDKQDEPLPSVDYESEPFASGSREFVKEQDSNRKDIGKTYGENYTDKPTGTNDHEFIHKNMDELNDQGYTIGDKNEVVVTPVDDENTLQMTSANPFYKKYFIMENKFRSIVTNQAFVLSAVLVYLAIGVIFVCVRSYRKKRYVRVPLTNCCEEKEQLLNE